MSKSLLFSILIPNYGYGKYLIPCLDSVFAQKTNDEFSFEVDLLDQSEKEVFERLNKDLKEKYKGLPLNVKNTPIKGVLRARHSLVKDAKGDYIVFIDSDDFIDEDYLLTIYESLKKNNFPDILIHNFVKCSNDGVDDHSLYQPLVCPQEELMDYFMYSNYFNEVVRKTFKRELYVYDEKVNMESAICDDWLLSFPLMKRAKSIVYEPEIQKYHYRMNDKSLTHSVKFDEAMRNISVHDEYLSKETPNEFQKRIFDEQIIGTYVALMDMLIKEKDFTKVQFEKLKENTRKHLYDINLNEDEIYPLKKNHKTIYKLLKKNSSFRLKMIFKIRKILK